MFRSSILLFGALGIVLLLAAGIAHAIITSGRSGDFLREYPRGKIEMIRFQQIIITFITAGYFIVNSISFGVMTNPGSWLLAPVVGGNAFYLASKYLKMFNNGSNGG